MRQLVISKSITNRDSASLDKYLADIAKLPLVTAEEETILAQKIRLGDKDALEKLTKANLRFVVSVAKQYQNQGIKLSDLINEGNLGLIKAAKRFDETRGFKFISYAVWWIRQAILESISNQARMVRLPLNKVSSINKIRKAQEKLEQQLERPASIGEVAELVGLSEAEISSTLMASQWNLSTDALIGGDDSMTLMDLLSDPTNELPDSILLNDSLKSDVKRALATLTLRESEVLVLYYGLGATSAHSLEEIAERYDLTRERVRQIKEKAIRRLKHESRGRILRPYL